MDPIPTSAQRGGEINEQRLRASTKLTNDALDALLTADASSTDVGGGRQISGDEVVSIVENLSVGLTDVWSLVRGEISKQIAKRIASFAQITRESHTGRDLSGTLNAVKSVIERLLSSLGTHRVTQGTPWQHIDGLLLGIKALCSNESLFYLLEITASPTTARMTSSSLQMALIDESTTLLIHEQKTIRDSASAIINFLTSTSSNARLLGSILSNLLGMIKSVDTANDFALIGITSCLTDIVTKSSIQALSSSQTTSREGGEDADLDVQPVYNCDWYPDLVSNALPLTYHRSSMIRQNVSQLMTALFSKYFELLPKSSSESSVAPVASAVLESPEFRFLDDLWKHFQGKFDLWTESVPSVYSSIECSHQSLDSVEMETYLMTLYELYKEGTLSLVYFQANQQVAYLQQFKIFHQRLIALTQKVSKYYSRFLCHNSFEIKRILVQTLPTLVKYIFQSALSGNNVTANSPITDINQYYSEFLPYTGDDVRNFHPVDLEEKGLTNTFGEVCYSAFMLEVTSLFFLVSMHLPLANVVGDSALYSSMPAHLNNHWIGSFYSMSEKSLNAEYLVHLSNLEDLRLAPPTTTAAITAAAITTTVNATNTGNYENDNNRNHHSSISISSNSATLTISDLLKGTIAFIYGQLLLGHASLNDASVQIRVVRCDAVLWKLLGTFAITTTYSPKRNQLQVFSRGYNSDVLDPDRSQSHFQMRSGVNFDSTWDFPALMRILSCNLEDLYLAASSVYNANLLVKSKNYKLANINQAGCFNNSSGTSNDAYHPFLALDIICSLLSGFSKNQHVVFVPMLSQITIEPIQKFFFEVNFGKLPINEWISNSDSKNAAMAIKRFSSAANILGSRLSVVIPNLCSCLHEASLSLSSPSPLSAAKIDISNPISHALLTMLSWGDLDSVSSLIAGPSNLLPNIQSDILAMLDIAVASCVATDFISSSIEESSYFLLLTTVFKTLNLLLTGLDDISSRVAEGQRRAFASRSGKIEVETLDSVYGFVSPNNVSMEPLTLGSLDCPRVSTCLKLLEFIAKSCSVHSKRGDKTIHSTFREWLQQDERCCELKGALKALDESSLILSHLIQQIKIVDEVSGGGAAAVDDGDDDEIEEQDKKQLSEDEFSDWDCDSEKDEDDVAVRGAASEPSSEPSSSTVDKNLLLARIKTALDIYTSNIASL